VVKIVTKRILETAIYPSQSDFKEATERYLDEENPEFMRKFRRQDNWEIIYERYFCQSVSLKKFMKFAQYFVI